MSDHLALVIAASDEADSANAMSMIAVLVALVGLMSLEKRFSERTREALGLGIAVVAVGVGVWQVVNYSSGSQPSDLLLGGLTAAVIIAGLIFFWPYLKRFFRWAQRFRL